MELGTLESILSGRPYEEVADDPRSGHLPADGGECWVVTLTDGAATALAAARGWKLYCWMSL